MESRVGNGESISSSGSSVALSNQKKPFQGIRVQNPFTFKVGQVFTGFGIGCGLGIGVGRPINLGAIPVVNQVMSATSGATYALSGVTRHVNDGLRKLGAKNVEAGIGCGVGFGHGFGVGLALKPGVINQIQSNAVQLMTKVMLKFGMAPNLSIGQGALPASLQGGLNMMNMPSNANQIGNPMQLGPKLAENISPRLPGLGTMGLGSSHESISSPSVPEHSDPSTASRTEKVLNDFLQNPVLKQEDSELKDLAGRLRAENNVLQMVLKHQQVIEELMEENEKLRQILVEDLKVSPSKIKGTYSSKSNSPCDDCFECRRRQRRK
ncbi:uncharacterized protein LOC104441956 isoform X1 [Eucalyptus grandis]|uniref:uncharacterized protein LOC104441956 isoform X1 n=1 Tax=Eucalyptus grandis TaxID=71139 RepID=UPI00192F0C1E|nr:uncharacterized protein LOC104441956 isoform X1 [Eucalyptus grandis]